MRVCVITDIVSPHQMPLAQEVANVLGVDRFRYLATSEPQLDRAALGWEQAVTVEWVLQPAVREADRPQAVKWAEDAEVVLCGHRDIDLFERRCRLRKATFYMSERWFKPPVGMLRLCHPGYLRMAARVVRLCASPYFYYLPMGIHAVGDMHRIISLIGSFGLHPVPLTLSAKQRLWGYFIGSSDGHTNALRHSRTNELFRILWFGRFLKCKKAELLLRAVKQIRTRPGCPVKLKLIGTGPEEAKLRRLAEELGLVDRVEFHPPKPIMAIRDEIRNADVCVVTSTAQEGWGVAVNEAMIEGCCVIASDATGAGATLIQDGVNGLLFKSGSCEDLACQLQRVREDGQLRERLASAGKRSMLDEWVPKVAAERLIEFSESLLSGREPPRWASGPLSVV